MAAKKAASSSPSPKKPSSSKKEKPLPPADSGSGFLVEQPVSIWNRHLKADFPKLFTSLGTAIAAFGSGKWDSGVKGILDAATAIGLKAAPAQVAWRLIFISLARASDALIEEAVYFDLFDTEDKECAAKAERIAAKLEDITISLEPDFFEHPGKLSILKPFAEIFRDWLVAWGIEGPRADAIRGRFTSYFIFELRREWRKNSLYYESLIGAIETPFDAACEKERSWLEYAASLQRQISEPMFDESFSLDDIYIPLRGSYEKKPPQKRGPKSASGDKDEAKAERHMIDLQEHLLQWAKKCSPQDAIRVLSGGPGSGKSSFCKIFAARNADALRAEGITTIFISLHHFDPDENLAAALQRYLVEDTHQLAYNPLEKDELEKHSVLLICDGLDELSQQGYVGAKVASDFVRVLTTTLSRLNNGNDTHLRVLITGREIVISSNKSEFHGERLVEMVPFCPAFERDPKWPKHGRADLLNTDQRHLWWQTYGTLTGRGYTELPQELATPQFLEITAQPLLNYLVALSLVRENIRFDEDTTLNDVYEDLIDAVHERAYEPAKGKSRQHSAIGDLSKKNFFLLLEEIALSAWHGDGRKTTVTEITKHLETSGLLPLVEKLGEVERSAKSGVTKLLVAFFFRESEVKGAVTDDTFEFTHKSFGEYLTARRLVRLMGKIVDARHRNLNDPTDGWTIPESLDRWATISGPTRMDPYLFDFFTREVARNLQEDENKTLAWREVFRPLFRYAVLQGTPMQNLPAASFQTLSRWANHAEESLLAAYNACLRIGKGHDDHEQKPWSGASDDFGTWLQRIRGQRMLHAMETPDVALLSLSRLHLSDLVLDCQDFEGAKLDEARLEGSSLNFSIFTSACLQRVKLAHSSLFRSVLYDADLRGAYLRYTFLQDADLRDADLKNADLQNADLRGTDLRGADLQNADLVEATLINAKLQGTNLFQANFAQASIKRSQLSPEQLRQIHGEPNWQPEE